MNESSVFRLGKAAGAVVKLVVEMTTEEFAKGFESEAIKLESIINDMSPVVRMAASKLLQEAVAVVIGDFTKGYIGAKLDEAREHQATEPADAPRSDNCTCDEKRNVTEFGHHVTCPAGDI